MHVLITGGAGFIGSRIARTLAAAGHSLTLIDNHSRVKMLGTNETDSSLAWGRVADIHGARLISADIRELTDGRFVIEPPDAVIHCAGQVGVAAALNNPILDEGVNVLGTVALLAALETDGRSVPFIFFSTNKAYGDAVNRFVTESSNQPRAELGDPWHNGITEEFPLPLDGLTPYGCSKRAAELYILDAGRREQITPYVLRCSCVYGPGQLGAEDQGWVSHVIRSRLRSRKIRFFGDGFQSRDLLHVDDLSQLVLRLVYGTVPSGVYNVGGGVAFSRSLLEVVAHSAMEDAPEPLVERCPPRLFDQRAYATNFAKIAAASGWKPEISPDVGIAELITAERRMGSSGVFSARRVG